MKASKRDEREALRTALRERGLRVTTSRVSALDVLREATGPLSHADVASKVQHLGFDRATVYRNLIDLTEAGIVKKSEVGHTFRFELIAVGRAHDAAEHPHFVCTDCGRVTCLPSGAVRLRPSRGTPSALRKGEVEVQVRGLCDRCG